MLDYLLNAFSGPGEAFMWPSQQRWLSPSRSSWRRPFSLLCTGGPLLPRRTPCFRQANCLKPLLLPVYGRSGLESGQREDSAEMAWDAMSAAAVRAEGEVRKRINLLSAVGNVATMLGLLGTVYGLTVAFSSLGEAGQSATDQLSEGISMAMATTAFGLCVAIPCVGAHAWLEARAEALLLQTESLASEMHLAKKRSNRSDKPFSDAVIPCRLSKQEALPRPKSSGKIRKAACSPSSLCCFSCCPFCF